MSHTFVHSIKKGYNVLKNKDFGEKNQFSGILKFL